MVARCAHAGTFWSGWTSFSPIRVTHLDAQFTTGTLAVRGPSSKNKRYQEVRQDLCGSVKQTLRRDALAKRQTAVTTEILGLAKVRRWRTS